MNAVRISAGVSLVLLSLMTLVPEASSLPRMSAASGAPCSTCHYSPDGSGLRTDIGFGTQTDMAVFDYEDLGIGFLDMDTNKVTDWLAVGGDVRIQTARSEPRLVDDPEVDGGTDVEFPRRVFPMQIEPQIAVLPTDWLTVTGSWTPGPGMPDGDFCSGVYAGQMCGHAQAIVSPDPSWPTVRAGLFRPHTGVQHDDHTMLVEVDASRSQTSVLPANYAEFGAEAYYQPKHWFRVDAGAFRSDQLAESLADPEMVEAGDPAFLGRFSLYPRFDFGSDRSFYGWAGASVYGAGHFRGSGSFRMDRGFFGLGWLDRGSVMVDVGHLDFATDEDRRAFNVSTTLSVEVWDWLIAEGRLEQATTWHSDDTTDRRRAAVAGLQIYPVPFVKLRPEYRYTRTDDWHSGQYALQLHLYY